MRFSGPVKLLLPVSYCPCSSQLLSIVPYSSTGLAQGMVEPLNWVCLGLFKMTGPCASWSQNIHAHRKWEGIIPSPSWVSKLGIPLVKLRSYYFSLPNVILPITKLPYYPCQSDEISLLLLTTWPCASIPMSQKALEWSCVGWSSLSCLLPFWSETCQAHPPNIAHAVMGRFLISHKICACLCRRTLAARLKQVTSSCYLCWIWPVNGFPEADHHRPSENKSVTIVFAPLG